MGGWVLIPFDPVECQRRKWAGRSTHYVVMFTAVVIGIAEWVTRPHHAPDPVWDHA